MPKVKKGVLREFKDAYSAIAYLKRHCHGPCGDPLRDALICHFMATVAWVGGPRRLESPAGLIAKASIRDKASLPEVLGAFTSPVEVMHESLDLVRKAMSDYALLRLALDMSCVAVANSFAKVCDIRKPTNEDECREAMRSFYS